MMTTAKWYSGTLGPKVSWHLTYRWGKTPKKPHPGNLSRPGIEPGPAAWQARMIPLAPQRWTISVSSTHCCILLLTCLPKVFHDGSAKFTTGNFECMVRLKRFSFQKWWQNNLFNVKSTLKIIVHALKQKKLQCFTSKPNAHGTFWNFHIKIMQKFISRKLMDWFY